MYYEDVFRELNRRKVKYLIIGGIAVNLYGVPRFTKDLDIFADMDRDNLLKLVLGLQKLGYKPKVPVKAEEFAEEKNRKRWIKEKGMLVFNFYHTKIPYLQVDILIKSPLKFKDVWPTRKVIKAGKIRVLLISINDLIKMKSRANRKQDLSDIEMLREAKRIRG